MTSLANQLKSLALPHTQAILGDERKRVSLLFDPSEAANIDKEAVFAIGISGLEELVEVDNIFIEYQKSLFNESASGLQRLTQTSDVNKKLDETIKLFLLHLSPYFLLKPAHKTLEWLIYRYQVHLYNIDDLLVCAFPYHDSNIFIRLLQTLNLSDPKSKWHWLEQAQKHGTQLPCQTIATHAYKDEGFLNFVSSIPEQFIDVHGFERTGSNSPVHAAVAFYTKIILMGIHMSTTVKESFIAQLATFLLKGLKSRNDEYKCSAYMILSSLCSRVSLDSNFVQSILPLLTKRMTVRNGYEAISCLVLVLRTQPSIQGFPKRCFKHMCRLPGIVQHLEHLHNTGSLYTFWKPLMKYLVPAAIKDCRLGVTSSSDGGGANEELIAGKPSYWPLLESLLSDCELDEDHAGYIIQLMCESYVENKQSCHTEESQSSLAERVQAMLRLMEQKYSQAVDAEIQKQMESCDDNKLMQEFALLSISSFKYKGSDDGVSMLLRLNSPYPPVRVQGVQMLAKLLQSEAADSIDGEFVSNALDARLRDDDVSVAAAVLDVDYTHLHHYLSAKQLVDVIKSVHTNKIRVPCCEVLARHPHIAAVTDDVMKLALMNAHQRNRDILSLICSMGLPLLEGLVVKKANYYEKFRETVAKNIAVHDQPNTQMEILMEDANMDILQEMFAVLASLCAMKSVSLDTKRIALSHLIQLQHKIGLQTKSQDSANFPEESLAAINTGIIKIFEDWSGDWHSSESVVKLYHSFLSNLIAERKVEMIVATVDSWIQKGDFDRSFVTLVMREDDSLTLNLLHLVIELPDDILDGLHLAQNGKFTVGCLLSLLMSDQKMIRKLVLKLLARLDGLSDNSYKLHSFVAALLSQSREIKTDYLHVPEGVAKFLEEGKFASTLNELLKLIVDETLPGAMVRGLMLALSSYRDSSVLVGIKDLLRRLLDSNEGVADLRLLCACLDRFDESSAELLAKEKELWDLFVTALQSPVCQQHALSLVSKKMFDGLQLAALKGAIISHSLDIYRKTEHVSVQTEISKLIKRITLPAEVVTDILNSPLNAEKTDDSMKTKKFKRSEVKTSALPTGLDGTEWKRVRLLLEWLQNKKKLENSGLLITPLFNLITCLLETSLESPESDYMKHLLLGSLDNVLNKLNSESDEKVPVDHLNIESIVQCIRTSQNPQTHQQALLVLKSAAKMYPNRVLHHVMSIFTYMGANIMRQDDMYSFQIITKTLDTVVPEIVKASDDSGEYTITSIVRVFVDAYPHIPEHRRLPLFSKLLHTIGDYKYLYACTCLCIENLTTSSPIPESTNEYDWKTTSSQPVFLLSLFTKFPLTSQLEACTRMLEFLSSLQYDSSDAAAKPARKTPKKAKLVKSKNSITDGLFDTTLRTPKQLRHFTYESSAFIVSLLSSSAFVEQVVNNQDDSDLTSNFNQLVEMGLCYIGFVAKETSKYANHPTAKFWKALLHKAYEVLDKVNALLPSLVFIDVISSLLKSDLILIRRKALDLLNNRLPQTVFKENELNSLVDLIPIVKRIALDHTSEVDDNEDTTNRQTALFSLKILTRVLASTHSSLFAELLSELCEVFANMQMVAVQANILLLFGELICQLKVAALPSLPAMISCVVSTLQQHDLLHSNHLLWISAITTLQKIVESVPQFLSQYLLDLTTIVCKQSSVVTSGGAIYKGYKAQLPLRLKSLRESLAKEFSPRVLVPVFIKTYTELIAYKPEAVEMLMGIVADHIASMGKEDLSAQYHKLLDLFLLALDYRATQHEADPFLLEETETSIISATLKMIVKLSESAFRPMYFKLYAWATREAEVSDRLITFYRLSDQIAETLRGLFSLFASHIVKNASDVLNLANSSKKSKNTLFQSSLHRDTKNMLLCKAILNCLFKCFLYDTEGFVNKQRFDMLMQPLVDQLENLVEEGYEKYVKEYVVPCTSQLALAVGDDSLWKPLVYQICLKTRHSSAEVRKGSLHVLRNLNSKLGEDFMTLLPETIPFLAELMEDDEEEVELLCQDVIADMETVLGEPLQKYF